MTSSPIEVSTNSDKDLRKSPSRVILSIVFTLIFVFQAILTVGPLIAALFSSFRPGRLLMRYGLNFSISFDECNLNNYLELFNSGSEYFRWFWNSFVLTAVSVILMLFFCYFIAYGLSMYNFRGRNFLFFLVLATMMVPFEILMLPLYREIIKMKLINTMAGVILPGICSSSTIFFFRQYLIGMPKELLDAGRIDGCTEFGISVRIMMPIAKPAFASMRPWYIRWPWKRMRVSQSAS